MREANWKLCQRRKTQRMPKKSEIFGRKTPIRWRAIEYQIQTLEAEYNPGLRAIAENLRIDDRVPEVRANRFFHHWTVTGSSSVGLALRKCQSAAASEFWDPDLNRKNLVYAPSKIKSQLKKNTRFIRILYLTQSVRDSLRNWLTDQTDTERGWTSGRELVEDWLMRYHQRCGLKKDPLLTKGIKSALQSSHELRDTEKEAGLPFHADDIIWVGLKDKFDLLRNSSPHYWLEMFGMGHHLYDRGQGKQWIIVLSYDLTAVSAVARPSILEMGNDPWRRPAPNLTDALEGGRTLVLGKARDQREESLAEFIHINLSIKKTSVEGVSCFQPLKRPKREIEWARWSHRAKFGL